MSDDRQALLERLPAAVRAYLDVKKSWDTRRRPLVALRGLVEQIEALGAAPATPTGYAFATLRAEAEAEQNRIRLWISTGILPSLQRAIPQDLGDSATKGMSMDAVILYTCDGREVTTIGMPPFQLPPEVIGWGERVFVRREDGRYYEGFIWICPPASLFPPPPPRTEPAP